MSILAISGSPRIKNTEFMLKTVLDATGQPYEIVHLKDLNIKPCTACGGCYESHECIVEDDMQELYSKLQEADALVLGSPTHFDNVTSIMLAFMQRCLPFYSSCELEGKKAALVAVGNLYKGEIMRGKSEPPQIIEELSVMACLDRMRGFCSHLGIEVVKPDNQDILGVIAIRSDTKSVEDKLRALGRKLVED